MDIERFDSWVRALTRARSRRGAVLGLLSGGLGLLSLTETEAKRRKKKKKKKGGGSPPASPPPPSDSPSPPSPPPPPPPPVPVCTPSCTNGMTCQNGTCACPPGRSICAFTGTCTACCINADCCNGQLPCPGGQICVATGDGNRVCSCTNSDFLTYCNGVCIDVLGDNNNCGRCGRQCEEGYQCLSGFCSP